MNHAGMLLRRTHVARILESDPGMAGFKQHRQHLAPQVGGRHLSRGLDLAPLGLLLVSDVGFLEVLAEPVVQVGAIRGREQRPVSFFHHPAHEQIGYPVRGVHVVGATTVIPGVLAQFEKLFDVKMPGFQVGADRPLAFAALVDGDGGVIHHLQEGNHALGFTVGALDVRAQRAHAGPVVAKPAGELGQQCVLLDRFVNAVQVVGHRGQVARGQLRAQRAAVEQRGRARHEVERR